VGLWAGHADVDAVTALARGQREMSPREALRRCRTRLMPPAQYFPLRGMNLTLRRESPRQPCVSGGRGVKPS